jgi:hypothetical protein
MLRCKHAVALFFFRPSLHGPSLWGHLTDWSWTIFVQAVNGQCSSDCDRVLDDNGCKGNSLGEQACAFLDWHDADVVRQAVLCRIQPLVVDIFE